MTLPEIRDRLRALRLRLQNGALPSDFDELDDLAGGCEDLAIAILLLTGREKKAYATPALKKLDLCPSCASKLAL